MRSVLRCAEFPLQGGFPITSIREIRILRNLQHNNIVELLEVVTDSRGAVTDGKVRVCDKLVSYITPTLLTSWLKSSLRVCDGGCRVDQVFYPRGQWGDSCLLSTRTRNAYLLQIEYASVQGSFRAWLPNPRILKPGAYSADYFTMTQQL